MGSDAPEARTHPQLPTQPPTHPPIHPTYTRLSERLHPSRSQHRRVPLFVTYCLPPLPQPPPDGEGGGGPPASPLGVARIPVRIRLARAAAEAVGRPAAAGPPADRAPRAAGRLPTTAAAAATVSPTAVAAAGPTSARRRRPPSPRLRGGQGAPSVVPRRRTSRRSVGQRGGVGRRRAVHVRRRGGASGGGRGGRRRWRGRLSRRRGCQGAPREGADAPQPSALPFPCRRCLLRFCRRPLSLRMPTAPILSLSLTHSPRFFCAARLLAPPRRRAHPAPSVARGRPAPGWVRRGLGRPRFGRCVDWGQKSPLSSLLLLLLRAAGGATTVGVRWRRHSTMSSGEGSRGRCVAARRLLSETGHSLRSVTSPHRLINTTANPPTQAASSATCSRR